MSQGQFLDWFCVHEVQKKYGRFVLPVDIFTCPCILLLLDYSLVFDHYSYSPMDETSKTLFDISVCYSKEQCCACLWNTYLFRNDWVYTFAETVVLKHASSYVHIYSLHFKHTHENKNWVWRRVVNIHTN